MPINFLNIGILIVSLLTGLTVEGLKKILDETKIKYSSNMLAVIVSVILSLIISIVYLILNDITFTLKIGVQILIFMYLGFLVSTVGYDKVLQTFTQIKDGKEQ